MNILQTTDLKKYYGTEPNITKALDGVTLSIEKGEFVAIVGTSGSGKSTLLNMMGGLDTPTSGSIEVKGKELSKLKDEQLMTAQTIPARRLPLLWIETENNCPAASGHRDQRWGKVKGRRFCAVLSRFPTDIGKQMR